VLRLGERVDHELNRLVHALAAALLARRPGWLVDLVPAYASLGLHLDPAQFDPAQDPQEIAATWVRECWNGMSSTRDARPAGLLEIPVRYGGEQGPDLAAVAERAGIAPREVVARHAAVEYRVAMLGFAPGFPYLLGLDPRLATPRLAQPRARVEAGSVAIGGAQTGIYPRPGPAGWRVIGRTAILLFDPERDPPSLLQPGDRVRFVPLEDAP
jgi:KipI family sensor histidine kinase inhibitor